MRFTLKYQLKNGLTDFYDFDAENLKEAFLRVPRLLKAFNATFVAVGTIGTL